MKSLLQSGEFDPNQRNFHEETVLMWSVCKGDVNLTKLLIQHNANVSATKDGMNLAHFAATSQTQAMLPYLSVVYDINLNSTDHHGRTPLSHAAESGRHQTIQWLLRKKCDPMLADLQGNIPLHYAIANERTNSVYALLDKGYR